MCVHLCERAHMCMCVHGCVHTCVRVCVRVGVGVRPHVHLRACVQCLINGHFSIYAPWLFSPQNQSGGESRGSSSPP